MNLSIFCSSPYQATCCSDQQHCCPQDTTCDISEGKCNKKDEVLTWTTESLALLTLGNIKCDDTHYCPEGNTCCKILTGTWGCCPLPKVWLSVLITLGEFHCQWASWGVRFAKWCLASPSTSETLVRISPGALYGLGFSVPPWLHGFSLE